MFHLSGLVPRLIPDAHVKVFLIPTLTREPEHSLAVNKFPVTVRSEDFTAVYLDFENEEQKRVLSVVVGPKANGPKIDKGGAINVSLNRPKFKTFVGRLFLSDFAIRHTAFAGEGVQYATLPKWNAALDTIVAADDPTIVIRKQDADGTVLFSGKMEQGSICTGFAWYVVPALPDSIADGTPLQIEITHETGDLFGDLKETQSFVYKKRTDSRVSTPINRATQLRSRAIGR